MAKKKILTEDEIMQQAKEQKLSMLKDSLYHCGEPTYRFRIGDNSVRCICRICRDGRH